MRFGFNSHLFCSQSVEYGKFTNDKVCASGQGCSYYEGGGGRRVLCPDDFLPPRGSFAANFPLTSGMRLK